MFQAYAKPTIGGLNQEGYWVKPIAFHHDPTEELSAIRNAPPGEQKETFTERFNGSTPYYLMSDYFPSIVGGVRRRLSENGGDISEAEDIAHHVCGRAELLFWEKAVPAYERYSESGLPYGELGYWGRDKIQAGSGLGNYEIVRAGDGHHRHAIRPGVILNRAKRFADTCAFNGGYHRVAKGIENSVRGGGRIMSDQMTGYDKNGYPIYERKPAKESAYDHAIHGAINESPRSLAFGARLVDAYEPAILAKLSPATRQDLQTHHDGYKLDMRLCDAGLRNNRRLVAALQDTLRSAIADYLDNTAYATA